MSRSCQSATFSIAGITAMRTRRARPVRFSVSTGLRLCGIADEPFCPAEKNSSPSSTSVRCMWRISMAMFSMLLATTPSAAKNAAWRSRGITCVLIGSGCRPSCLQTCSSTAGSILAKVPTAPEIAPVAISCAGLFQAVQVAVHLGVEAREGQAHRRGFGMDAVAAADADGVLVLERAALQRGQKRLHVVDQDVAGAHQLHVEAGVQHVRGGHALMHEARLVAAHMLGQMGQEGDDVMLGHGLDLVDAGHVEFHVLRLPDGLGVLARDDAQIGHGVAGMRLDLEPDAEFGLGRPDGDHFGAGIAGNHGVGLWRLGTGCAPFIAGAPRCQGARPSAGARDDLRGRLQRAVHRAFVGDFQQTRALIVRQIALEKDDAR